MKLTQENRYLSGPADVRIATVYGDDPQATMDAAHIAMCVNNHDELVAALQVLADIPLESFGQELRPDALILMGWNKHNLTVGHVKAARNALAKVKP